MSLNPSISIRLRNSCDGMAIWMMLFGVVTDTHNDYCIVWIYTSLTSHTDLQYRSSNSVSIFSEVNREFLFPLDP